MDDADFRKKSLEELKRDRSRGASQLARRCLEILAEYAVRCDASTTGDLGRNLETLARDLQATRPSMAPVQNLLNTWTAALAPVLSDSLPEARQAAAAQAHGLIERSVQAVSEISRHAATLVPRGQTLITHSLSSTMVSVMRELAGRGIRAVITESRPLLEGRTLAGHLSKLGIPAKYITDAQMGIFVGDVSLAMVGADGVLGDGSAVNKAGTYLLALAARDQNVPFYVCCESFKFTSALPHEVVLEEMDATELRPIELAHITPRNVYFDITPARLITAWITEKGIFKSFPLTVNEPSASMRP